LAPPVLAGGVGLLAFRENRKRLPYRRLAYRYGERGGFLRSLDGAMMALGHWTIGREGRLRDAGGGGRSAVRAPAGEAGATRKELGLFKGFRETPRRRVMSQSKSGGAVGPFNSVAEAAGCVQTVDWMLLVLLFFAVLGGYHVHFMLTAGDWDFWVDWKDRRMWPTVVPILGVTFCAASQAFWWVNFRLPFGAVFAALGLLIGEWINRYVNFWGWTYFPISLVFPSALIVPAIWLDVILLLSGSYVITAIVGALGWGLLFYPNNWPAIAAFHQATEQHGQLMTLADLIGFHFVRTSMPEYIRMVERGTLRTFGKDVVPVAAFFSGFVSMLVYFLWWFMGRWYSTTKVIDTI
jgi:methane/ammonia monooxygenase subunit A